MQNCRSKFTGASLLRQFTLGTAAMLDMDAGGRTKAVRSHFGLSATQMAEAAGLKNRKSWEDYERGNHLPTGPVLLRLAEMGINTNWLLTGQGQMLLCESPSSPLNEDLLGQVIAGVEELLAERGYRVTPAHKAELIGIFYRHYLRQGGPGLAEDRAMMSDVVELLQKRA